MAAKTSVPVISLVFTNSKTKFITCQNMLDLCQFFKNIVHKSVKCVFSVFLVLNSYRALNFFYYQSGRN